MFLSLPILLELREVLQRPKFLERLAAKNESPDSLMNRFRASCQEATPASIMPPAELLDPDDRHILACAAGVGADLIVTGDQHLLKLKFFREIPIIDAVEALKRLGLS